MSKEYLCKCNNCDVILIDENPQINAEKFELKGGELHMIEAKKDGEFFIACPNCETDDFLTDLEEY